MQDATVMYGVGAAQAGTSWLNAYCATHPSVAVPALGALHYFDALEGGASSTVAPLKGARELALKLYYARNGRNVAPASQATIDAHLDEINDWFDAFSGHEVDDQAYITYLQNLAGDAAVVVDITDEYGTLSQKGFKHMLSAAPDAKIVMILRDPLDRLWADIQSVAKTRDEGRADVGDLARSIFAGLIDGQEPDIAARSNYKKLLRLAHKNAKDGRVLILFYEELGLAQTAHALCSFLDIPQTQSYPQAPEAMDEFAMMSEAIRKRAVRWLQTQYEAVAEVVTDLPAAWHKTMAYGNAPKLAKV